MAPSLMPIGPDDQLGPSLMSLVVVVGNPADNRDPPPPVSLQITFTQLTREAVTGGSVLSTSCGR